MTKQVRLGDLFTEAEIDQAIKLWNESPETFHKRAKVEIVEPAIPRINARTGQQNDAGYFAYAIEAALSILRAGNGEANGKT
jgi:hypothetical protein